MPSTQNPKPETLNPELRQTVENSRPQADRSKKKLYLADSSKKKLYLVKKKYIW
jgi:hypothetical protein